MTTSETKYEYDVDDEEVAIDKVFLPGEAQLDDSMCLYVDLTQERFREIFGFLLPNMPETITLNACVLVNLRRTAVFPVNRTLRMEIFADAKVLCQLHFSPQMVPPNFVPMYDYLVKLGEC